VRGFSVFPGLEGLYGQVELPGGHPSTEVDVGQCGVEDWHQSGAGVGAVMNQQRGGSHGYALYISDAFVWFDHHLNARVGG
jgi:hypothetical protein